MNVLLRSSRPSSNTHKDAQLERDDIYIHDYSYPPANVTSKCKYCFENLFTTV